MGDKSELVATSLDGEAILNVSILAVRFKLCNVKIDTWKTQFLRRLMTLTTTSIPKPFDRSVSKTSFDAFHLQSNPDKTVGSGLALYANDSENEFYKHQGAVFVESA